LIGLEELVVQVALTSQTETFTIHIVLKYLVAKLILAADTVSVCKNDLSFLYNSLLITVVLK